MIFALIGNPNCGKTTLFNSLTGATAKTGNWSGVTVEKKTGKFKGYTIVDLPGVYSLFPYTPEETVSRNVLLKELPDCIINVIDVTNLERSLGLTLQLLELDIPVILALNMIDLAEKKGLKINKSILEKRLNVPVIEISALKRKGLDDLIELAVRTSKVPRTGQTFLPCREVALYRSFFNRHKAFYAVKLLEGDPYICDEYPNLKPLAENLKENHQDFAEIIAKERAAFIIDKLAVAVCVADLQKPSRTDSIDNILTHRIWGLPIFLTLMFMVFHFTFSKDFLFLHSLHILKDGSFDIPIIGNSSIASPGMILYNCMEYFVHSISEGLTWLLKDTEPWCSSLLVKGIWGGVGAILSFLPNLLVLFLFITILEDCGYMARAAFLMDRIFKGVGLSGKAFIPLISCFGCAVPGILATKTLKSEKERRITIMLTPFFSCGAKLPIWTAFSVLLFNGAYAELIIFGVYLYGILIAILAAAVLNRLIKGKAEAFLMEMPEYRLPQAKNVILILWDKCKHYIIKAGTLIAASTIVLWALTNFDWSLKMTENINSSLLGSVSRTIAFLFYPLGFGRGEYQSIFVIGIFAGFIAKEEVPAVFTSLGVLEAAVASVSPAAIFSYMSFNLLVIPCMAAVSAARGELQSRRYFWFAIIFWVITAYICSMLVYVMATLISRVWWILPVLCGTILFIIGFGLKRFKRRIRYADN